MGRLIEQQAVIDCLTNTAKYYEREDADECTKGIHYGLLHGVDNILDNVPTVEAIPKDQYEARLKADLKAILVELQLKIEENGIVDFEETYVDDGECIISVSECNRLIQQKINDLKVVEDGKNNE